MEIIGLSGYARSGKDEAAKVLVEEYGFIQVAFADKLREVLYALNPLVTVLETETIAVGSLLLAQPGKQEVTRGIQRVYVQDVIDKHTWNGYKETIYKDEIRRLLQRLGTEAGRQALWDTIWIDAAFAKIPDDAKVVVSDARFFNEFDAVRDRGGIIWRIEREGVGPVSDHPSETEAPSYPHFERVIRNDGTLGEYRSTIREAYNASRV